MKFDTLTISMIVFTIAFLMFLAHDYEKEGSFIDTIQITLGIKEPSNGPKPEDTLVAGWADPGVKAIETDEEREDVHLPVNSISIEKPHRSQRHVAEWLTQHIGNALILDKEKISKLSSKIGPFFTPTALEQYKRFGQTSNIFSAVFHGENTTLNSYSKDLPLYIASGPANGIHEWEYETLMVLSLVKSDTKKYKNNDEEQQMKEVYFCVSVIRNNEANEDGLLISRWKTGRCNNNDTDQDLIIK